MLNKEQENFTEQENEFLEGVLLFPVDFCNTYYKKKKKNTKFKYKKKLLKVPVSRKISRKYVTFGHINPERKKFDDYLIITDRMIVCNKICTQNLEVVATYVPITFKLLLIIGMG